MSESKRGRKSIMGLLDLTNIIDSSPESADSGGTLRRSLRLRRKSISAASHGEQTHPSKRYSRKSVINPQTHVSASATLNKSPMFIFFIPSQSQWNIGPQA
uniref:Uncharacterized protein n=1 Tax=Trichobilharzia regenti TaxID=157069 RepID=A0AA85JK90_TRIRE|nr:unnamed protein product [Trichobilharzia regenti]